MTEKPANLLSRLEQRQTDYPLLAVRIVLIAVLLAGIILAIRSGETAAAVILAASLCLVGIAILLDVARTRRLEAVDDRKFIQWDSASPDVQRQNVNVEVRELAKLLGVGQEGLTDLLSAYIVAEDLALRQMQQEENLPLMRHVSIGRMPFDGIDRKSTRLNSSHIPLSRMPSSA